MDKKSRTRSSRQVGTRVESTFLEEGSSHHGDDILEDESIAPTGNAAMMQQSIPIGSGAGQSSAPLQRLGKINFESQLFAINCNYKLI